MNSYSASRAKEVKADLRRRGIPLKVRAAQLGITPSSLSNLLNCRVPAHWGKMHDAAVKLGLKKEVA
ncbi:MAG: hypothetical protein ACRDBH_09565 [Bosea sp. (in: a-proteobacteria)]